MPFLTDRIYQLLAPRLRSIKTLAHKEVQTDAGSDETRSVHFLAFPDVRKDLFDEVIERRVSRMRKVIELGRSAREKTALGIKSPLKTLVVIGEAEFLDDVHFLERYVIEELNIRELVLSSDEDKYNVTLKASPNWPRLGQRLKKDAQKLRKTLPTVPNAQLRAFLRDKRMTVDGIELDEEDLIVVKEVAEATSNGATESEGPKWAPMSDNEVIVLLDTVLYPELADEGLVRDLISRLQRLRKKAGLVPTDNVRMEYRVLDNAGTVDISTIIQAQQDAFRSALRGELAESTSSGVQPDAITEETEEMPGLTLALRLLKI